MTRRPIPLFLSVVAFLPLRSQSIGPDVISTSGGYHSTAQNRISYTIGQPVYTTVENDENALTQGFQQPWVDITADVPASGHIEYDVTVFPNPARHILHVVFGSQPDAMRFDLVDDLGKSILAGPIRSTDEELDLSGYAAGMYHLRLLSSEGNIRRTFKVNLNH